VQLIDSQDNVVAEILASVISVGWSILTSSVVPVITFEDVDARDAITRSGVTFKSTWGETAGATFGVGIVTILFMLPIVVLAVAIVALGELGGGALGLGGALLVAVPLVFVAYIFTAALGSIARLALYVYAVDGERPSAFENVDLGHVPE
jgi:CBS domain containing-hemolysin-like protein